jgi:precorrin-6B methylase 2
VYGLLAGDCHSGGEWVLAYSPTSSAATSRNCPVTLTSLDQRVVTVATNDVTGAQTVVAVGAGSTSIDVSVNGVSRLVVPVTVTGIGN